MDHRAQGQNGDRAACWLEFPKNEVTTPASPGFLAGHDDEAETLVMSRTALFGPSERILSGGGAANDSTGMAPHHGRDGRPQPPPLPIALVRRKDAWIQELAPAARRVLEEAQLLRPSWPLQPRIEGSVARPRQRIPSLIRRRAR